MTNNLRKIKQDLCAYIKRCKDVHYSDSLLITFLMSGMIFARNNLFSAPADPVEAQKTEITNSIHSIRQQFKQARSENNKLLKATNLELTKLMEQGDHVTKSPWSSWQFGMNYFNNNWNGTYKGRGDKKEKYPYEGVFQRSLDVYERSVSPDSDRYSLLSRSANPYSASSNARQGIPSGYGIASTKKVTEPIVGFEVNAGIRPKTVNKSPITIAAKTANVPVLPGTIGFVPPTVTLPSITPPTVSIPTITAPSTGNGDGEWIHDQASVGILHQQNLSNGTLTMTQTGNHFTLTSDGVNMTGESGAHATNEHGVQNWTYQSTEGSGWGGSDPTYAAMKLVGGQEINIDNVTINYNGTGTTAYQKWLFHTDGHNDNGESTWVLNSGTNINMSGSNLVLWTSQYHSGTTENANIGFVNDGNITISGNNNLGWIALNEGYNGMGRQHYFHNRKGTININGTENVLAFIQSTTEKPGDGWAFINDKDINMTGDTQYGIVVSNLREYESAEILLNKPITISGKNSVGVAFKNWVKLEGGAAFSQSTADNIITTLSPSSDSSIIKLNISGNKNTGVYFDSTTAKTFTLKNYDINIDGVNNVGFIAGNGAVKLETGTVNKINIKGSKNAGIYTKNTDDLETAATMTLTGATESVGLYAKNTGTSTNITNKGKITGTGLTKSIGIVAEGSSKVTNKSEVDVEGTGVVGLVAKDSGATIDADPTSKVKATGSSSAAAYTEAGAINFEGGSRCSRWCNRFIC